MEDTMCMDNYMPVKSMGYIYLLVPHVKFK